MHSRAEALQSLTTNPRTSALIVGAGINGIGTFRDLALQGVDCLIIDRGDFCSGASMASSHMLHGGIRYLENGEFRLVREALHERNNLLRNAPHLTKPLPTTIPIFKWLSGMLNAPLKFIGLLTKPAERGALIIKLGLMMYDFYVRGDSQMPSHVFEKRSRALERWPEMNPGLLFAATYYDGAMTSPERLALEILADGLDEGPHARAVNYLSAVGAEGKSILLRDELSGQQIAVQPEIVLNAGGPWIDQVNREIATGTNFIGGTKGSHLIVKHPGLRRAIGDHEIFFEYLDGRIVLIFPYLEDLVLIGSTDLRIDDPDEARCTDQEVDYILGMVPKIFPGLALTRQDIVFQFSGVRPLPAAKGSTGQISRDHSVEVIADSLFPWPILSLVGGKWTSYRAFSEQAADEALKLLGQSRKFSTARLAIGGGADYPLGDKIESYLQLLSGKSGLDMDRVRQLFKRYGTRAALLAKVDQEPLSQQRDYTVGEIRYLVQNEMAAHLDDLLLRRTKIAWGGALDSRSLRELGSIMGSCLAWSGAEEEREVQRALELLRDRHAVRI